MRKAIHLFIKVIVSTYLCTLYTYISIYGFIVGACEMKGDNAMLFFIVYIVLAILFPLMIYLMYHYICYLIKKVCRSEDALDNIDTQKKVGKDIASQRTARYTTSKRPTAFAEAAANRRRLYALSLQR